MASAWNASEAGAPGGVTRGRTQDSPVRVELHDRLMEEYEHRSPEGANAPARLRHWLAAGAWALALFGVLAMVYALGVVGGWAAAVLGSAILAMFFVAGWSGYVFGGAARVRERAHIESEVVKDIEVIRAHGMTQTGEGADRA